MGTVKQGDRLYDEYGKPCSVVYTTDVMLGRPCNRVLFSDGTCIVADDDHIWLVQGPSPKGEERLLLSTRDVARLQENDQNSPFRVAASRALQMPTCQLNEDPRKTGKLASLRGSLGPVQGSVSQRRRLLRGFIEATVGYSRRGHYRIECQSETLTIGLRQLLTSLGYVSRQNGRRIDWSVGRKAAWRSIVSVHRIASAPVRCLQVNSPSRLYLCGETCIPTHNTFLMAEEIRRAARLAVAQGVGTENELWYAAPTFLQAKRVMWSRLKKAIPERWMDRRPNETDCSLRLRSGHVIRIVGLDAFENLRGSGLWFFGGDEWADCRPEAWNEVIRPMLSTSQGHALFIGTPKGFDHFRDAYIAGQPGGDPQYRSFLFTTLDGGNVPPDEVEAARRQLDARTFRQEYGASFESYAGRVVYAFSRAENVKSICYDPHQPVHIGMDFNINPMSATVWQEDGETTRQIDEIVLPTSNTDEIVEEIRRRYGRTSYDPLVASMDHITVYPDPAGAQRRSSAGGRTDIGILRAAGLRVRVQSSHPAVRDRTNVMNQHFLSADGRRIAFVAPCCTKSIEAYERLAYRDGSNEPDKSQGYDHLVDASGYYLYHRTKRSSPDGNAPRIMER